jgi:hypothetical protein
MMPMTIPNNNNININYNHNNTHPYSSSCGYCLDNLFIEEEQPFQYNHLIHLLTAPDIKTYLSTTSITEDVYALPIHIQILISEAKEEIISNSISQKTTNTAQTRLERLKTFVWQRSNGDIANLMSTLVELMSNEDLIINIF